MAYETINKGNLGTASLNQASVVPDIEKVLQILKPYQTPLLQFLWFGKRDAKEVKNAYAKFSWFENEFYPHQTNITAAISSSGTPATLTLASSNCGAYTIFNLDDIVLIEETEQMAFVSAINSSQAVLTHIDGTSNLTSLENLGGYIKIIGSRNSENNGVRTAVTTREIEKFNYLTIFSESIATTGRQQAGEYYTDGTDHAALVAKRIEEMKLQAERYFMFAPSQGYATSGNYRTTWGHGFLGRVTSNVNTYTGTLSETVFDDHLMEVFEKGSNYKIHLCGSNQLKDINAFIKSRYELVPDPVTKVYGVDLREYITPFGKIGIVWNPVMDGKFANYGFTIDANKVRLRFMAADKKGARKFRVEEGVETPGQDGTTTKILMDIGLELHNEECHGILKKA